MQHDHRVIRGLQLLRSRLSASFFYGFRSALSVVLSEHNQTAWQKLFCVNRVESQAKLPLNEQPWAPHMYTYAQPTPQYIPRIWRVVEIPMFRNLKMRGSEALTRGKMSYQMKSSHFATYRSHVGWIPFEKLKCPSRRYQKQFLDCIVWHLLAHMACCNEKHLRSPLSVCALWSGYHCPAQ